MSTYSQQQVDLCVKIHAPCTQVVNAAGKLKLSTCWYNKQSCRLLFTVSECVTALTLCLPLVLSFLYPRLYLV